MERFTLELSERDDVIAIVGGKSMNLGPRDLACEELRRFLAEQDEKDWASAQEPPSGNSATAEEGIDHDNFRIDPTLSSGL